MYIILPLFLFLSTFMFLLGRQQIVARGFHDWRGSFLQACVVWGGAVVIFSELLSLFNSLSGIWLIMLWGAALVAVLVIGWQRKAFHQAWVNIRLLPWASISWLDGLVIFALLAVILLLFMIAWKAVPNTTDALLYHMSRVMHWAQNGNLSHYPTQYQHQLINPIWSELVILNLRLFWGNDQLAGLVQWFSMVGSLVGVSAITGLLGAGRKEQLLASVFVAGIPIGILQATSTQNDYVTAFWLVCMVYFLLLGKKRELILFEWFSLGGAIGLGILTKGTFYLYAFPFLLWFFIPRLMRFGILRVVRESLSVAVIVVIFNVGFWTRNLVTYQGPLGSGAWLSNLIEVQTNPRMWLPEVTKHVGLNFSSTIPEVNAYIISLVESVSKFMGVEIQDFGAFPWWNWNHEDLAGNPLHMLSVFFTFFILILARRREQSRLAIRYALITLSLFFILSITLKFNLYIVRFHLPFFLLWGAVFGYTVYYVDFKRLAYVAAVLIFIAAGPWLIMNRTRCLFAYVPHTNLGRSVLSEQPDKILFANWHSLREPFNAIADAVKESDCMNVGLKIDSSDLEYPYWWLLGAPQSGYRIESLEVPSQLERYIDPNFKPCVIICTVCGDRERVHGLERVGDFGEGLVLYTGLDYTVNEDG